MTDVNTNRDMSVCVLLRFTYNMVRVAFCSWRVHFLLTNSRIVHALMIAANVLSLHCAKMPYDPTPQICLAFGEDCQVMMRNRMGATKAISFGMRLAVFKKICIVLTCTVCEINLRSPFAHKGGDV